MRTWVAAAAAAAAAAVATAQGGAHKAAAAGATVRPAAARAAATQQSVRHGTHGRTSATPPLPPSLFQLTSRNTSVGKLGSISDKDAGPCGGRGRRGEGWAGGRQTRAQGRGGHSESALVGEESRAWGPMRLWDIVRACSLCAVLSSLHRAATALSPGQQDASRSSTVAARKTHAKTRGASRQDARRHASAAVADRCCSRRR